MSIGIEVKLVLVRNHETLWKLNDTHFTLGTVLPRGYKTPRMKFSLGNTKPIAVSPTSFRRHAPAGCWLQKICIAFDVLI